jgi:hypothetical protein
VVVEATARGVQLVVGKHDCDVFRIVQPKRRTAP